MRRAITPRFPHSLGGFDARRTPVLKTDVLVIGAGIAGASAALAAADRGASVLCVSKTTLDETNSAWAQGGVAAVLTAEDSAELHLRDTLDVGNGLASADVARAIIAEGPRVVRWLEGLGAEFDRTPDGDYALGREGGHSVHRVVHAHGAATGAEIQRVLGEALARHPRIQCKIGAFVRDLLVHEGRCVGAVIQTKKLELGIEAGAVVIASGGAGHVYRETTNPIGACGDGVALGFRAGARVADMEFVQFHPTTLYIAGASRSLISEVVRGAGAVLRDKDGVRFMPEYHEKAELAPRDVVSRAILDRMVRTSDTHVYLDLSSIESDPHRAFPTISEICRAFDIDIATEPIPVRPGAHYMIGGIAADLDGHTSVPGLFAVGEAASTRFHGANRLASNSLLEGAVVGHSTGIAAAASESASLPSALPDPVERGHTEPRLHLDDMLYSLKNLMWRDVGLVRNDGDLEEAVHRLGLWNHYLMRAHANNRPAHELTNMLTVSTLVCRAAAVRCESRGTHYRSDHPERDDSAWCRHVHLSRGDDGSVEVEPAEPLEATDVA